MIAQDWEALLALPIDEVRAKLGIERPTYYEQSAPLHDAARSRAAPRRRRRSPRIASRGVGYGGKPCSSSRSSPSASKTGSPSTRSGSRCAGEILGLVGPNGAGKTTTLRCAAGILEPDAGEIAIDGIDLSGDPLAAKRRLALVPDEPHLFARLSVVGAPRAHARLYDVSGWEPLARELLGEFELGARRDTLAEALSRGMRQKVAVASALIHAPSLLMLDEPLVGSIRAGSARCSRRCGGTPARAARW